MTPIFVGGSALSCGRSSTRSTSRARRGVRARWTAGWRSGAPALYAVLAERDPEAAERSCRRTDVASCGPRGRRADRGAVRRHHPGYESVYPGLTMIGLDVPRDVIDARLDHRVDQMWEDGFVDEVGLVAPDSRAARPRRGRWATSRSSPICEANDRGGGPRRHHHRHTEVCPASGPAVPQGSAHPLAALRQPDPGR